MLVSSLNEASTRRSDLLAVQQGGNHVGCSLSTKPSVSMALLGSAVAQALLAWPLAAHGAQRRQCALSGGKSCSIPAMVRTSPCRMANQVSVFASGLIFPPTWTVGDSAPSTTTSVYRAELAHPGSTRCNQSTGKDADLVAMRHGDVLTMPGLNRTSSPGKAHCRRWRQWPKRQASSACATPSRAKSIEKRLLRGIGNSRHDFLPCWTATDHSPREAR